MSLRHDNLILPQNRPSGNSPSDETPVNGGFTKFPARLFEHKSGSRATVACFGAGGIKCIAKVYRDTSGWGKRSAVIGWPKICKGSGLGRSAASEAICVGEGWVFDSESRRPDHRVYTLRSKEGDEDDFVPLSNHFIDNVMPGIRAAGVLKLILAVAYKARWSLLKDGKPLPFSDAVPISKEELCEITDQSPSQLKRSRKAAVLYGSVTFTPGRNSKPGTYRFVQVAGAFNAERGGHPPDNRKGGVIHRKRWGHPPENGGVIHRTMVGSSTGHVKDVSKDPEKEDKETARAVDPLRGCDRFLSDEGRDGKNSAQTANPAKPDHRDQEASNPITAPRQEAASPTTEPSRQEEGRDGGRAEARGTGGGPATATGASKVATHEDEPEDVTPSLEAWLRDRASDLDCGLGELKPADWRFIAKHDSPGLREELQDLLYVHHAYGEEDSPDGLGNVSREIKDLVNAFARGRSVGWTAESWSRALDRAEDAEERGLPVRVNFNFDRAWEKIEAGGGYVESYSQRQQREEAEAEQRRLQEEQRIAEEVNAAIAEEQAKREAAPEDPALEKRRRARWQAEYEHKHRVCITADQNGGLTWRKWTPVEAALAADALGQSLARIEAARSAVTPDRRKVEDLEHSIFVVEKNELPSIRKELDKANHLVKRAEKTLNSFDENYIARLRESVGKIVVVKDLFTGKEFRDHASEIPDETALQEGINKAIEGWHRIIRDRKSRAEKCVEFIAQRERRLKELQSHREEAMARAADALRNYEAALLEHQRMRSRIFGAPPPEPAGRAPATPAEAKAA